MRFFKKTPPQDVAALQEQIEDLKDDIRAMQDHYGNHLQAMVYQVQLLKLMLAALSGPHSDETEFDGDWEQIFLNGTQRANTEH